MGQEGAAPADRDNGTERETHAPMNADTAMPSAMPRTAVPLTRRRRSADFLTHGLRDGWARVPNPVFNRHREMPGHDIIIDCQDRDVCQHHADWISSHGTNQYGPRWTCCACGLVLWSSRVDRRALVTAAPGGH